jgi:hypothetical protein
MPYVEYFSLTGDQPALFWREATAGDVVVTVLLLTLVLLKVFQLLRSTRDG